MIYSSRGAANNNNNKAPVHNNDPNRFIRINGNADQMRQKASELVAITEAEKIKRQELREAERAAAAANMTSVAAGSNTNNAYFEEQDSAALLEEWVAKRQAKRQQLEEEKARQLRLDSETGPTDNNSVVSDNTSSDTSPSELKSSRRIIHNNQADSR